MQVDLSSDYFDLFGLTRGFDIDTSALRTRYRELQKSLHPDRYAAASDAERRWSVQAAAFVNEAERVLAKPLHRAVYLLELEGVDTDTETDTSMPPDFLMQQMEMREQLADIPDAAEPYAKVDAARNELNASVKSTAAAFASSLAASDLAEARQQVRQWQFLDKLLSELGDIEAALDDA